MLFSSEDPFRAVGISQKDFFRQVLALKWQVLSKEEFIKSAVMLAVENGLSMDTLRSHLLNIIVEMLKTNPMKELAISQCDSIREQLRREMSAEIDRGKKRRYSGFTRQDYKKTGMNNDLVEMVFLCYASLHEFDKAVDYFKKNYLEQHGEIALWVLLELLWRFGQKEYWVRAYEDAVAAGITPRAQLQSMYQNVKGK